MRVHAMDLSKPSDSEWKVFQDSFAVPQPRTIKAWERAPVPSHAPRLQGQKIWKRAGVKTQRETDKENFEAAQVELLKEGNGARKRMRMRGAKENIGNPTWKEDTVSNGGAGNNGNLENEETKAGTPIALNENDASVLQFVPRKRTNANHVITPRKPMKQSTLTAQAQTQGFTQSQSPSKPRRRKSVRKSIRKSAVGVETVSDVAMPVEERHTIAELTTELAAPQEHTTKDELVTDLVKHNLTQERDEDSKAEISLNDKLNVLFDFIGNEKVTFKGVQQSLDDQIAHSSNSIPFPSRNVKVPLNDLARVSEDIPCLEDEGEQPEKVAYEHTSRGLKSLEMPSAIIESIEGEPGADMSVQSSKTTRTPKKKRETSQRSGTRRSNRMTRASSVRPEEQPVTKVDGHDPLVEEPTKQPLETALHVAEDLPEVETVIESELVTERASATEGGYVAEMEPANMNAPVMESDTTVYIQIPETHPESFHGGIDIFDVSVQPVLECPAIAPGQNMANEDFELPPPSSSLENASLKASCEQDRREVSGLEERSVVEETCEEESSPVKFSPTGNGSNIEAAAVPEDFTVEALETLEPLLLSQSGSNTNEDDMLSPPVEDILETATPDPTTSALVEIISENAPLNLYEHDETDLLRNFVTRVKANKAAKASTDVPKRKRSLPHSPLRLPLGETDAKISPSDQKMKDELDVGLASPSPSKRQKCSDPVVFDEDDTITERKPTRRSGRTRLPVVKTPLGAPSHIPVRRLGQDGDTTVTLRRSEEKELAALTRVNTRKNKGVSLSVPEHLAKKAEEKEDPVLRQRFLKEVFDDKAKLKGKKEKRKTVVWAEELTQYQTVEARKVDGNKEKEKEAPKVVPAEEKKGAVKVGIRSKIALGMASNGTPAPKRKSARS